ncbi:MAG: SprT family zinc-dependent metalloprotease [Clostridiales bacterium]|nr:SprT family zinc-dependent metalloprotease [Clostridiales bacterium]
MERITFGGRRIEYRIKRGRRKKSVAITIANTSQVVVSAPRVLSNEEIRELVQKKAGWIQKKQAYFRELRKLHPEKEYVSGEQVLFLGRKYRLKVIEKEDGPISELMLMGRRITISINKDMPEEKRKEIIREALTKWYYSRATEVILQRAKRYSQLLNLAPKKIIVRNQQKRWGSCSKNGALRFNWRISMAPVSIIDYVVVHEICHLKQKNHSSDFWRQVALVLPDYKKRRQWLRENLASLEI